MATTSADTPPLLATFGLQEKTLAHALHATNAAIYGGAALTWYLETPAPPEQDIDIWCQPAEPILRPLIYTLYDSIFRSAGYFPDNKNPAATEYYNTPILNIVAIHNWYNPTLKRKIQLIIRKQGPDISDSPDDDFDLDITTIRVVPNPTNPSTLTVQSRTADLCINIDRRVMSLYNLRGQNLHSNLYRVNKYYARGFAFETTETACSCPCGAATHTIITSPRRMGRTEAIKYVRRAWIEANPLPDNHPLRADVLQGTLLEGCNNKTLISKTRSQLITENDQCREALLLPQNEYLYPDETAWLREYYEVLQGMIYYHQLQERYGNRPSMLATATIADIAGAIQDAKRLIKNPVSDIYPDVFKYGMALIDTADSYAESSVYSSSELETPESRDIITYV